MTEKNCIAKPPADPLSTMAERLRAVRKDADAHIGYVGRDELAALDLAIRVAEIIGPFARGFRQWVRIVARVEI